MSTNRIKIAFLDRDGVINAYPGNHLYVCGLDEFRILPGAVDAVRRLMGCGFRIVVCSNQAGVAKGLYTMQTLEKITAEMVRILGDGGARIDAVYYCTHTSGENCPCRKPKPGLVTNAVAAFREQGYETDMSASWFIGDSITDVQTGKAAGLRTILVFSGKETPENSAGWAAAPDHACNDITEAAAIVCAAQKEN